MVAAIVAAAVTGACGDGGGGGRPTAGWRFVGVWVLGFRVSQGSGFRVWVAWVLREVWFAFLHARQPHTHAAYHPHNHIPKYGCGPSEY